MPVEIMELVVKAKVSDPANAQAGRPAPVSAGNNQDEDAFATLEKTIREAVEILKRKNER